MYKVAIFDIDGTLIDTERTGVLSLVQTIQELMGFEMPYDQAYKYFGIPSKSVAGALGYTGSHEDFSERWEDNFVALSYLITPFEGIAELLAKVKSAGIMTGIVTSRNRMEFEKDMSLAAMLGHFDHIICAEDAPRPKPYPDPILRCLELCSQTSGQVLAPADCIYLGDTEHDWRCADAAGCDFALADWKQRGWQGIPAKYRFTDAAGAMAIF